MDVILKGAWLVRRAGEWMLGCTGWNANKSDRVAYFQESIHVCEYGNKQGFFR